MIKVQSITEEHKAMYQSLFTKHTPVGWLTDNIGTRLIVKMKPGHKGWTPSKCARDCGDHYIVAHDNRYDRIDKRTLAVTTDVEDR